MPPFFTLQPVLDTRKKQIELWCDLILDYVRHNKIYSWDINEAMSSPLFYNSRINRRLSKENILIMLDQIISRGNGEWENKDRSKILMYWRTPAQWGDLLYKYITERSMKDVVCTLYELREGDEVSDQEFYMLDLPLFMQSLRYLEQKGQAVIFQGNSGEVGVKFK